MKYFAALCVLALLAGGIWWLSQSPRGDTAPNSVATTTVASQEREIPEGWKEYRKETYNFSLLYPEILVVTEREEGEGAMTVIFEDAGSAQGFQIFIVPYSASQVSEERFRLDIPSGVRRDMKDITIGGATGASFFSEHEFLGETAEIWVVRGGYLYEITTLKPLHSWLSGIVATWLFL